MTSQRSTQPDAVEWLAPHRLSPLRRLCGNVAAPWKLVPSATTVTGTIILHDANGMAIADLYTAGPPTDVDKLIAVAPSVIAVLIEEVTRLQERSAAATPDVSEPKEWADRPTPEDDAIHRAFPTESGRHDLYGEAMRLVGDRHSKGALVALVNWLLYRIEAAYEEGVAMGADPNRPKVSP